MMALVMAQARSAARTPDIDGDWGWDRLWRSDDSDSSSDDGTGAASGGAVDSEPAQAGGSGGGFGSDGAWRSTERYALVQHELRNAACEALVHSASLQARWHGPDLAAV